MLLRWLSILCLVSLCLPVIYARYLDKGEQLGCCSTINIRIFSDSMEKEEELDSIYEKMITLCARNIEPGKAVESLLVKLCANLKF